MPISIFWGGVFGPPNPPLFYHFWVNWGAPKHPPKYFLGYFYLFFILFGLSAFQDFFTFHFTMILRDFMILLKLFAFFGKNLGILLNKITEIVQIFNIDFEKVNEMRKLWNLEKVIILSKGMRIQWSLKIGWLSCITGHANGQERLLSCTRN